MCITLVLVSASAAAQFAAATLSRPVEYYNPDWPPDGRSLVFESTLSGTYVETTDAWLDSAGQVTARQSTRTARGSLATDLESVRALTDSATLLLTPDRMTGWVVTPGTHRACSTGRRGESTMRGVSSSRRSRSATLPLSTCSWHHAASGGGVYVYDGRTAQERLVVGGNGGPPPQ